MNCNCYSCNPDSAPVNYNGDMCSICLVPIGTGYPNIPSLGSVCVQCLAKYPEDKLSHDPIFKIKFPRCSCGGVVTGFSIILHGGLSKQEGHEGAAMELGRFRRELKELKTCKSKTTKDI